MPNNDKRVVVETLLAEDWDKPANAIQIIRKLGKFAEMHPNLREVITDEQRQNIALLLEKVSDKNTQVKYFRPFLNALIEKKRTAK